MVSCEWWLGTAQKSTSEQPSLVVILTTHEMFSGRFYALTSRMDELKTKACARGHRVRIVAPDGTREFPPSTTGDRGVAAIGDVGRSISTNEVNLLKTLSVFWRAIRAAKRAGDNDRTILVFTPGWLPFLAVLYSRLLGLRLLHFDVPGLPDREASLAKYRFWRAKVPILRFAFKVAMDASAIVTTVNGPHAWYIEEYYSRKPIVVPDKLPAEWLLQLLAIPAPTSGPKARVFYAGSLANGRLDDFLFVARDLVRKGMNIVVRVAGDGPDRLRYEADFRDDAITFVGHQPHSGLATELASCDICYSDVWSEIGTPYKLLEYMAAGRAIITNDTESTREILENGVTAILSGASREALGASFVRLISNPDLRAQFGRAAREAVRLQHSTDQMDSVVSTYVEAARVGLTSLKAQHSQ